MLRLRSEPASPQDGLPEGALRLAGRCALRVPLYVAHGRHDGNEGEWTELPPISLEPFGHALTLRIRHQE